MSRQEEIPLYSRPVSHSYTQNIIDIDSNETVATVTTVTVLDKAGHAKVKVMLILPKGPEVWYGCHLSGLSIKRSLSY